MTQLETDGITVELPLGFEGRATRRSHDALGASAPTAPTVRGQATNALTVLHASTVAMPNEIGDFGSNVVSILGQDDVFVSLFEFDGSAANSALFAAQGVPASIGADEFSPGVLQRWIKGQAGSQRFFTVGDRAFCLYVVLGAHARRAVLSRKVNALLASLQIDGTARGSGAPTTTAPPTTLPATTPGMVLDVVGAQADLARFRALVGSDLTSTLATSGPWTVFAPTDAAFDDASAIPGVDDPITRRLVAHHCIAARLDATSLVEGQTVITLADTELTVARSGLTVTIGGSRLIRPDLDANNGVVHVIEHLLVPPS